MAHRTWNPAAGPEAAAPQVLPPPAAVSPDGRVPPGLWAPSEGPCRHEVGGAGGEPEGWSVPIRIVCWE
jgi:hypothetical protein